MLEALMVADPETLEPVTKNGETLGEIVESVKRVTDIVAEIAAARPKNRSACSKSK